MSLASEPMSRVDTAWLRMDTPENLMMIVGVWFLRPRITVAQLRARCEEKLLPYPRFRQRVVCGQGRRRDRPAFGLQRRPWAGPGYRAAGRAGRARLGLRSTVTPSGGLLCHRPAGGSWVRAVVVGMGGPPRCA